MDIPIGIIKDHATRNLKNYTFTVAVIKSEPDTLSQEEFVIKCKVWLQLLRMERHMKESR